MLLTCYAVGCRGLTSLAGCEDSARTELVACSTQQCGSLQTAADDLLQAVDVTTDKLSTFGSHVTDLCDKMHEVGLL